MSTRSVHLIEVADSTLTVHMIDAVGNNLTHRLMWCAKHHEPAWVYGDGSFRCWWEDTTGHHQHLSGWGCGPEFHDIVALAVLIPPDEVP